MILVDTSIWVDHLRNGNARLIQVLNEDQVLIHPFIIGELSLGTIRNRSEIMSLLSELPVVMVAEHTEVLAMVTARQLSGTGIGWVDAHLITSALLAHAKLLTSDKALLHASRMMGLEGS